MIKRQYLPPCLVGLVYSVLFLGGSAHGQSAASAPASSAETAATTATTADGGAVSAAGGRSSLPTGQIIAILQEKPEIVIELKSLLADRLTAQGVPTQPDSITDEALYSQIVTSSDIRDKVTTFLRARGYITNADLQRSATLESGDGDDDGPASVQTIDTLSQLPGADFPQGPNSMASRTALLQSGALPGALDGSSLPPNIYSRSGISNPSAQLPRGSSPSREPRNTSRLNITDPAQALHLPAPYNLLVMRDLYTQVPEPSSSLKRFGSDVFLHRAAIGANPSVANALETPLDIPIGPDYVVGPGDSLTIDMWGGISQSLTRMIDREGHISLPEAGSIEIAGMTLERAQTVIINTLKRQYRDLQAAVTIARLRTVRVYVVGDVQRPGAYDLSSLSSPLNALYAAGGPTSVGSLRTLRHYRGNQLLAEVDLYDFLLHGMKGSDDRFQGGDTLLVPPAGPQVAVSGAVKRPAIYELQGDTTLATLLDDAGGATVEAALNHITVERIDANQQRETVTVSSAPDVAVGVQSAIAGFHVKDGDRIHLAPILPYSERAIYLDGHVVRPGRLPYRDGMKLSDVLHSYQDLLPEPADRGEIIRLIAPDLHAETIEFSVSDALIGNFNIEVLPFDTIRVLGRYEADAPRVAVRGEILRPGSYPLSRGMTAAQLVRMAGGLRRDALLTDADLTSYEVVNGSKAVGERTSIRIGDALRDHSADAALKAGDVLTVHQITGWNDIGASISIEGEVGHSGSYGIQQGERLSSVLRRGGGFRDTAYPMGAVLVREQVRELEEKSRQELIHQIETSSAAARLSPNLGSGDSGATLQIVQQQQEQALSRLRSQPASGRLVIRISADIESWANTPADIEVRAGDVLTIPKRPGFVLVSGQVYNSSAITFVPGKTAEWYLRRAGGANDVANRKEIFVIRANGAVVGRHSGEWFDGSVLSTRLEAGDVVVVPQRIIGASLFWRNLLTTAQVASSIAITAAVAGL